MPGSRSIAIGDAYMWLRSQGSAFSRAEKKKEMVEGVKTDVYIYCIFHYTLFVTANPKFPN